MTRSLILIIALSACSTPPQPVAKLPIPAELRTCAATPAVPDATDDQTVANFILDLWNTGQDCRSKLQEIDGLLP